MFLLEEERIRDCLKETQKKLEIASSELEESNISYDKMKTEYEAIEEEVEEIDLAIETAKNRLNETNLLKQQLEGQINVLREQINTARMNDEHYDNRLNTVQSEINMRKEQKASFEEEKKNLSEKLREASQADTVVKKRLIDVQTQIAEHTEEIEQRKQEIMDLLGNRASTKAKIQHFDTTRDQISTRKSVLARNILEVSAKAKEQEEQLHEHEERLSEIQDKIRLYNMQITENEQKIQKLQEELNVRQEKLNVGRTAYHREASRLESLKNITERYDGYGNSIRRVMHILSKSIKNMRLRLRLLWAEVFKILLRIMKIQPRK